MSKNGRNLRRIGLAAVFLFATVLACGPTPAAGVVTVTITSPGDGGTVVLGQAVMIDSTVTAAAGVARVDLTVGGQVVRHDVPPSGSPTTFRVSQPWTPEVEGQASISVVGYDVNGASGQATVTLQVVASGAVVPTEGPGTAVPPVTEPTEPTETPPPPVTTEAGCTLDSSYVADVTIPDGTVMSPGVAFVKTWRVRNSGTCDWEAGFQLIFVSGAQMGGPPSVLLPAVAAGTETDVSVNLTAPATYGAHKGTWRIRSDEGTMFGTNLTVVIDVPAPVTDTPLPTGVSTTGPLPELEMYGFFIDPFSPIAGADFSLEVSIANFTNVPVADFTIHVLLMDPGESCFEGGSGTLLLDRQMSVAAQQYTTITTTVRIDSPGMHTLCLKIDPYDEIEELYEDDNLVKLTFSVAEAP